MFLSPAPFRPALSPPLPQLRDAKTYGTLDLSKSKPPLEAVPEAIAANLADELTSLKLVGNAITELPDAALAGLVKLRLLDVSRNKIATLPGTLRALKLQAFRAARNLLTAASWEAAAGAAGENALAGALVELDVAANKHATIPAAFFEFGGLKTLNMECNKVTSVKGLPMRKLKALITLSASGRVVMSSPCPLTHPPSLSPDLGTNGLKVDGLADEIPFLPNLVALHLENNDLAQLPPEVRWAPSLRPFSPRRPFRLAAPHHPPHSSAARPSSPRSWSAATRSAT